MKSTKSSKTCYELMSFFIDFLEIMTRSLPTYIFCEHVAIKHISEDNDTPFNTNARYSFMPIIIFLLPLQLSTFW